jgi:pectin methylesterase-like acyl-CoA thioesterase
MKILVCGLCLAAALSAASNESIVAADGSGQFRTVQAAVDAAPANLRTRFTPTVFIQANDSVAKKITFENAAVTARRSFRGRAATG